MVEPVKHKILTRPSIEKIRVIDDEGGLLGILEVTQALEMAKERELDLVELDPHSKPPTCKLMNYGRYKYNLRKKQKKNKKTVVKRKELKLRPKTEDHDFQVKLRHARKFLEEGHKVLVTMLFRGREQKHPELGFELLNKFAKDLDDFAKLEKAPARESSNRIGMILAKK
ncbi:MAG: translation initiation factor IF-3 [Planctomycetota bacterium]